MSASEQFREFGLNKASEIHRRIECVFSLQSSTPSYRLFVTIALSCMFSLEHLISQLGTSDLIQLFALDTKGIFQADHMD